MELSCCLVSVALTYEPSAVFEELSPLLYFPDGFIHHWDGFPNKELDTSREGSISLEMHIEVRGSPTVHSRSFDTFCSFNFNIIT